MTFSFKKTGLSFRGYNIHQEIQHDGRLLCFQHAQNFPASKSTLSFIFPRLSLSSIIDKCEVKQAPWPNTVESCGSFNIMAPPTLVADWLRLISAAPCWITTLSVLSVHLWIPHGRRGMKTAYDKWDSSLVDTRKAEDWGNAVCYGKTLHL